MYGEPVKTAAEMIADRQAQAAEAAAAAAAARAAVAPDAVKTMSAKAKRKLEAAAAEKEKEAKRLALYATLAQHQLKPEQLRLLESSSTRGAAPTKRQRLEHDEAVRQAMHVESQSGDDEVPTPSR